MVQISDQNCKTFWSMLSGRVRKIPPPSSPLSKDEVLKDNEHIMSAGNLILDVNNRKIPPPSPPLSKDKVLKDNEHIMSAGNLILDVNNRKIPRPSPPLSKDEVLKDIEHIMSAGNLILDVNSVTVSYLIHYNSLLENTTILLQNAIVITKCDIFITSYSV